MDKLYGKLNSEQLLAVRAEPGAALVIAAAGSGKTRVVTYRVCHLIASGVDPDRILLLTFTNKAAHEMLDRVEGLGGIAPGQIVGGTFHRVCHRILRKHAELMGFPKKFILLDQEDARDVLKLCLEEAGGLGLHGLKPAGIHRILSLAVNTDRPIPELLTEFAPAALDYAFMMEDLAASYARRKQALGAMDFDDLLWQTRRLFTQHPDVGSLYAQRFQHVLVDEYQDTSKVQGDLVDLLAQQHKNLMVVGDDFQSIYSFRGAHFQNILDFPNRYPDAKIYRLQYNYRSTPEILAVANQTIEQNVRQYPKVLKAIRPSGPLPALVPASTPNEQAHFIVSRISDLMAQGTALREIAILYRSHYHSLELQVQLTREGIPYVVRSGVRFFEQAHVKDVVAVLRILFNTRDEISWGRILKVLPGVGKVTTGKVVDRLRGHGFQIDALEKVKTSVSARGRPAYQKLCLLMGEIREISEPSKLIQTILHSDFGELMLYRHKNAKSRAEDLEQLADYALRFHYLEEFLSDLALLSGMVEDSPEDHTGDGWLTLTTVHQAKGLEWSVVFTLWLVEGRFPSARSLGGLEEEEEERRLFYVTVTRAKDELYLCYPLTSYSSRQGATQHRLSRFIREVGDDILERWEVVQKNWYL